MTRSSTCRSELLPNARFCGACGSVVDMGHLVAWDTSYELRKAAKVGFFSSLLSDEGIVAEFDGPGELRIRTRNRSTIAGLLKQFLPTESGGGFNLGE